jgi:hypothetical protein
MSVKSLNLASGELHSREYTQEEFDSLPIIPVKERVSQELASLERDHPLTQRALRELVMLVTSAFDQLSSGQLNLKALPGVIKVYEVENQAALLREKL